jgi:hypothetical protein
MFSSHSIIHTHNRQSLSICPTVSSKYWHCKKNCKGKKYLPWRNNCGKIVNFATTCMGSTPCLFISTYFLCKKALGSWQHWNLCYDMGENPHCLLPLLDEGKKWWQDEQINGMGKEYGGKDGRRWRYKVDKGMKECRCGSCFNLREWEKKGRREWRWDRQKMEKRYWRKKGNDHPTSDLHLNV